MKNTFLLGILTLSMVSASSVFARGGQPDITCRNSNGVEVTIEKEGFDENGAYFKGIINRDGRQLRSSKMRRALISNGFSLYAIGPNHTSGWSFVVQEKRNAFIADNTSYLSLAKSMGNNMIVKCDRNFPFVEWRK